MEFIDFISASQLFTTELWLQLIIGALCFAIVFIFQALALYTIAKREGYNKRWMAFVPFLSTYYIGVCAQKNKVYKVDTRKISLSTAIIEAVAVAGNVLLFIATALIYEYVEYEYFSPYPDIMPELQYVTGFNIVGHPESLNWAAYVYEYSNYILAFIEIAYIILIVFLLMSFYKTYATRKHFLFTLFSVIFPVKGILFYAVKNNKGINYNEYVRAEQERQYRMRQQYYNQYYNRNPYSDYNNPYNGGGYGQGYGGHGQAGGQGTPDDPFGDFAENAERKRANGENQSQQKPDPFDEFKN